MSLEAAFNTFLTALLSGLAGWLLATIKNVTTKAATEKREDQAELDALKDGVRALLHNKLFDYYREYQDASFIPAAIWKEIDRVYEAYHSLGGNHTGSRIYESLKAKPIDPDNIRDEI